MIVLLSKSSTSEKVPVGCICEKKAIFFASCEVTEKFVCTNAQRDNLHPNKKGSRYTCLVHYFTCTNSKLYLQYVHLVSHSDVIRCSFSTTAVFLVLGVKAPQTQNCLESSALILEISLCPPHLLLCPLSLSL